MDLIFARQYFCSVKFFCIAKTHIKMKKALSVLALAIFTLLPTLGQSVNQPNGDPNRDRIIFGGSAHHPRLADAQPAGWYYRDSHVLTIEFPVADFEPYTLTVSSPYNSLDYYVTTPFISVNISPDVVEVDLLLETTSGDMYYGSFEATAAGSTE